MMYRLTERMKVTKFDPSKSAGRATWERGLVVVSAIVGGGEGEREGGWEEAEVVVVWDDARERQC